MIDAIGKPEWLVKTIFGTHTDNEDCLFLDVKVPKGTKEGDNLPVIVWIYGGGYIFGKKDFIPYNPTGLFKRSQGKMIYVAMNYRVMTLTKFIARDFMLIQTNARWVPMGSSLGLYFQRKMALVEACRTQLYTIKDLPSSGSRNTSLFLEAIPKMSLSWAKVQAVDRSYTSLSGKIQKKRRPHSKGQSRKVQLGFQFQEVLKRQMTSKTKTTRSFWVCLTLRLSASINSETDDFNSRGDCMPYP